MSGNASGVAMRDLLLDLRHAVRTLHRQPLFFGSAVLVLALGIGVNTAIFSIVNAVLIDPLPYPHPERLVRAGNRWERFGVSRGSLSAPDLVERRARSPHLDALGGYQVSDMSLADGGEPVRVVASRMTSDVFRALEIPAALGRTFGPAEDTPGSDRIVVLAHGLWQRRYGGDRNVIGRSVRVDGVERTIVGVMPARFGFPEVEVQLWVPLALTAAQTDPMRRGNDDLGAIGRLKSGATLEQVKAEHEAQARAAANEGSGGLRELGYGANVWPLTEDVTKPYREPLLLLFGAVAFLLLLACVNIAHLMLARAASRRREFAIRTAMGAGRGRLTRQLLSEGLVIAFVGGLAGVLLAAWIVDVLPALRIAGLPEGQPFPLDARVLVYATLAAVGSGLLFGLAPVLQAAHVPPIEALRNAGTTAFAAEDTRRRAWLVAVEAALTVLLLVGAGLMARSLMRLGAVPPGFAPAGVLTARTGLPAASTADSARRVRLFDQLVERVTALPGVRAAGAVSSLPLEGDGGELAYSVDGQPADRPRHPAQFRMIVGDYFKAAGIPLRRGVAFTPAGRSGAAYETVIDETLARDAFPGSDPIGRRLIWKGIPPLTVVGVVGAIRDERLDSEPVATMYLPQWVFPQPSLALAVRGDGDPLAAAPAVRRIVHDLDPDLPVYGVMTMSSLVSHSLASSRTRALLLGLIAALALVLATVGVYGVTAHAVSRRTAEIGLRMALGAKPSQVLRLVLRQAMRPVVLGAAAGVVLSLSVGRAIASQLYHVRPTDPVTLATVPLVLVLVAGIATLIPARRAARVEPMAALREP